MNKIYIKSAAQISIQKPLSDEWMENPVSYQEPFVRSVDPNYKELLSPIEARRFGILLKRAVVTSDNVIRTSGIEMPDAIITGTGLGCIENTELFLDALCREGEQLLKPTYFMQSTHNTISSLVSIHTKNHGYNVTYAHKGISFDSALQDAWIQFQLHKINSALVGGHDEMTPSYFKLLQKAGFVGQNTEICGEAAVSFMLGTESDNAICSISGFKMIYKPSIERAKSELNKLLENAGVSMSEIDAVMTGISGNNLNDSYYQQILSELFGTLPVLHYKHVFGECYTASGLGLYAAARCLEHQTIPSFLYIDEKQASISMKPKKILVFNLFEGKNYSFTLLESVCGK